MSDTAFEFTAQNLEQAQKIIARYPQGRQASAVMPLLDLAQRQNGGWLPRAAIDYVADYLSMPRIRAHEVATFYSMYRLKPVGKTVINVCTTTPCWLRGSGEVVKVCEKKLGIALGETTEDGAFTLAEVECLGACVNAPLVQIGDDYYEDLDPESVTKLIEALQRGEAISPGPQNGRRASCPEGGPTTLVEETGDAEC
jgi:NADH-quinone oxidoreductase subunit E